MKTLTHPNMRDTTIEVEDDRVAAYVAQGWKAPEEPKPEKKTTTKTRSSAPGEDTNKEVNE